MARFIVHRLMLLPLLLVIFSVMVFAIVQAPPGDFLTSYAATLASSGSSVNLEQLEALRRQYGLDQPVAVQYVHVELVQVRREHPQQLFVFARCQPESQP